MLPSLAAAIETELAALHGRGRHRACPPLAGPDRQHSTAADGARLLSFCSNDYLGIASHPALAAAAAAAGRASGFGAGASRLVAGDLPEHRALEQALAAFTHLPSALLFPTAYQANIGLITALAGPEDVIVSDAANHASIIDGCRLSRARIAVYPHRDVAAARALLAEARASRRRLLVTESVFSMDGDVAPLADLAATARLHDAALIVDEAHALGISGPGARGICGDAGIVPDALIGALGKAFGTSGGFVAGAAALRDLLVNRARTFIFTTAPPPPLAAASLVALALVAGPLGAERRSALHQHILTVRAALPRGPLSPNDPATPIVPLILGADADALAASATLRAQGLFVQAIRPPTVPEGTARLRITLSAAHTGDEVAALLSALRALRIG